MNVEQLLADVQSYGAEVKAERGELILYAGERVSEKTRSALKTHKAELIAHMAANEAPLAAKLRALGEPIALEVDGEVIFWIVGDDEAALRADVDGVVYTAAEAEVLAQFDERGIRDLARLKAAFGGTLGPNDVPGHER